MHICGAKLLVDLQTHSIMKELLLSFSASVLMLLSKLLHGEAVFVSRAGLYEGPTSDGV